MRISVKSSKLSLVSDVRWLLLTDQIFKNLYHLIKKLGRVFPSKHIDRSLKHSATYWGLKGEPNAWPRAWKTRPIVSNGWPCVYVLTQSMLSHVIRKTKERESRKKKQGSLNHNLYRNLDRTSLIRKKFLIKEIMMHVKTCYDKFILACNTSNLSKRETCELSLYQQ